MITVERIEGTVAVLDVRGARVEIPAELLPAGAKEGDSLRLALDAEASADARARAEERQARLRDRSPKGPTATKL